MGKALLIIVLGAGLVLTQQLYSAFITESETGKDQVAYQQELIAREIANSAFNLGMGVVRAHGENVQRGSRDLNGSVNEGRSGTFASGRFAGGRYTVRSEMTSGHSVRVIATGYFGKEVDPETGEERFASEFTMHDEYRVPVLTARHDGLIDVSFLESQAGYCSAVFYQAFTPDMPEGYVPEPVMLFAPDNRDRNTARPAQQIFVEAQTQMNFFIGVDKNCSLRPLITKSECQVRKFAQGYEFDPGDFDHIHSALTVEAGKLDEAKEDVWGIVEQHPDDRQRWRIAWEDIHNTKWDAVETRNPISSLQALKALGYDGIGWNEADAWGYRMLKDFGSRPDLSDQVIEVEVISARSPNFHGKQQSSRERAESCGEEVPDEIETEEYDDTDATDGSSDPGDGSGDDPADTPGDGSQTTIGDDTSDDEGDEADDDGDELSEFACECTRNNTRNKVPILHRPPGNESNEQLLCLPPTAIRSHQRNHNDVFPSCNARREIRNRR